MPAMSDEETAQSLDQHQPAGKHHETIEDEDAALHSQLMANMEQNKSAHSANQHRLSPVPAVQVQQPASVSHARTDETPATTNGQDTDSSEGEEDSASSSTEQSGDIKMGEETRQSSAESDRAQVAGKRTAHGTDEEDNDEDEEDADGEDLSDADSDDNEEPDADVYADATSTVETPEGADSPSSSSPPSSSSSSSEAESDSEVELANNVPQSGESEDESDGEPEPCILCDQSEQTGDPTGTDLTCTVCRRPAHHSCATEKSLLPNADTPWRCPKCTSNQTSESPKETASKPRHSASRLVRDLLPVSRGIQKPGAHSIFAQPLIQDDDGGRALRKRKSASVERRLGPERARKKMKDSPSADNNAADSVSLATRRSSQKLAPALPPMPTARILQHRPFHKPPPHKFILAFRLEQSKIESILAEPPKPHRRRYTRKKQKIPPPPIYHPPVPKFPALPAHHLIFPSMFGDRENETNSKPYGGVLSEADAETSRSLPQLRDREIFESARKEAEEERKRTSAKAESQMNGLNGDGVNTTNTKRTVSGPPSKIKCIQFGKHVIDTSYAAPYPEEYSHESRLFICEFCLKYLPSEFVAWRHKLKCPFKHPPGDEIYRDGSLSVWEVDGRKKTEYCQCLCLMAKLFLGSKTLYYDVDPFLFYVLTEYDEFGYHFVGYFSKEKRPASQNNVSCILVMPIHQRKGYATFLIEFSYLLTRIEGKEGSPEKPLSDMGLTAYRSYWDLTISRHLLEMSDKPFSIRDIMFKTGMTADDVVHSLERLYAFVKDPVTKTYAIRYNKVLYEGIVEKYESKNFRTIRPERLIWTPYIMGRSDAAMLDAQPITAVAQREEDDVAKEANAEEGESERISPKTANDRSRQSPSDDLIDPVLLNDHGNVAPGPPPTDAMNGVVANSAEIYTSSAEVNGVNDKGKAPAEPLVMGYALAYEKENIPATRFQIDPPIPPAILRYAKTKRKSMSTPRPSGQIKNQASSSQATRSSPRKAGSRTGSVAGRASSRATTPDQTSMSVRRSGRRSGLANEIVNGESTSEQEDEDIAIDDDDVDMEDQSDTIHARPVAVGDIDNDELGDESETEAESSSESEVSITGEDEDADDDEDEQSDDSDDLDPTAGEGEEEEDDDESDAESIVEDEALSIVSEVIASSDDTDGSTEEG